MHGRWQVTKPSSPVVAARFVALGEDLLLIGAYRLEPGHATGHARALAVLLPDRGERHRFQLFHQCQPAGEVAVRLERAEGGAGLEDGEEERLEDVARAD